MTIFGANKLKLNSTHNILLLLMRMYLKQRKVWSKLYIEIVLKYGKENEGSEQID